MLGVACDLVASNLGMNLNTTGHRDNADTTGLCSFMSKLEFVCIIACTDTGEEAVGRVLSKEMEFFW